jgi:hypothetical protein
MRVAFPASGIGRQPAVLSHRSPSGLVEVRVLPPASGSLHLGLCPAPESSAVPEVGSQWRCRPRVATARRPGGNPLLTTHKGRRGPRVSGSGSSWARSPLSASVRRDPTICSGLRADEGPADLPAGGSLDGAHAAAVDRAAKEANVGPKALVAEVVALAAGSTTGFAVAGGDGAPTTGPRSPQLEWQAPTGGRVAGSTVVTVPRASLL